MGRPRRVGSWGSALALGALLAVASALIASPASATDVVARDPVGDLERVKGLSKRERRALDIVSMRIVGEEGLGLFVTVTFRGNLERSIGHSRLRKAVVTLVLHPRPGTGTDAGLASSGAGMLGKTRRETGSEEVAVVRDRRTLTFLVVGPGFGNVASVEAGSSRRGFAGRARDPARAFGGTLFDVEPLSDSLVKELDEPATPLGCSSLDERERQARKALAEIEAFERAARRRGEFARAADAQANANAFRTYLGRIADKKRELNCDGDAAPPVRTIAGQGACAFFDSTEIVCTLEFAPVDQVFRPLGAKPPARPAQISLDAIQMVAPGGRRITAFLCPVRLPGGSLSDTAGPNDTLTCSGGTLLTGQPFTVNIRTSPGPTAGMGVQLFGRPAGGQFEGPFEIPGP